MSKGFADGGRKIDEPRNIGPMLGSKGRMIKEERDMNLFFVKGGAVEKSAVLAKLFAMV